jgi:adenylate cyclase
VNEAARLTEAAKEVPGSVLASGTATEGAGDEASRWELVAEPVLRGRRTPTKAFAPVR